MRGKILTVPALLASGAIVVIVFTQQVSTGSAQTRVAPPYLRKYTTSGDLTLPKGFHEWAYVGPPPAPNALNNGKASLPEYHNVYIEPGSYAVYQKVHVSREGTIMFKEMQATQTGQQADGSRTEPSGRGYFPGAFNGADVSGEGTKRFSDTRGWRFLDSNHYQPKPSTIHVTLAGECAYCPIASAKKGEGWTSFYRLLDK